MLTTLRAFNVRAVGARKVAVADASSSAKPQVATAHLPLQARNARQGRMISMAQVWTRKATETQLGQTLRNHPLAGVQARSLNTTRPSNGLAHGAWSVTPKAVGTSKNVKLEAFQFSAWTMAAVLPVGMLFSPSFLNMPFDLILAFVVPFHAWYGVHHVIEDYVPPQFQPASNALLYVITAVAVLGLVNLSVQGDGILESIKSLWRDEKDKDDKKSKK